MANWISGRNLWRVGFYGDAFPLIQLLSGLVTIHETIWNAEERVLVFIVTNEDKTGTLFRKGVLAANPIYKYRPPEQPLMVDFSSRGNPSARSASASTDEPDRYPSS